MIYGDARVSTDGQSVDDQVRQLTEAGCAQVFREVPSGAKTDRAPLRRVLDALVAGDALMVTRLDRLARSTRDLIRARTGEGRERAKARGCKLGRKPKLTDHQRREALVQREHGEETLAEINRSYNVRTSAARRFRG